METKTDEDIRRKTETTQAHQEKAEADSDTRTGTKRWSEMKGDWVRGGGVVVEGEEQS